MELQKVEKNNKKQAAFSTLLGSVFPRALSMNERSASNKTFPATDLLNLMKSISGTKASGFSASTYQQIRY